MPEPRRLVGIASVGAVLAVVAAAAVLAFAPPPVIPPSGTVDLDRGDVAMTGWVEVPEGGQAVWEWDGGGYINFAVEVRGRGFVAYDDTGAAHGCVRGQEPFAVRMGWANTAMLMGVRPVKLNYSVVAQPDQVGTCERLRGAEETFSGGWFSRSLEGEGAFSYVLIGVAGNAAFLVVRFATTRPSLEERQRRIIERERQGYAREQWVAERVRQREQGRR